MKNHFRKKGWIFIPVSVAGWIISAVYIGIAAYTFIEIYDGYRAVFPSLIRFFPYFTSFSVVWYWVACNMSEDHLNP